MLAHTTILSEDSVGHATAMVASSEACCPPRPMPPDVIHCYPKVPRLEPDSPRGMGAECGRTAQDSARRPRDHVQQPLPSGTTHGTVDTVDAMRSTITDRRHRPHHVPDLASPMAPLIMRAPGAPDRRMPGFQLPAPRPTRPLNEAARATTHGPHAIERHHHKPTLPTLPSARSGPKHDATLEPASYATRPTTGRATASKLSPDPRGQRDRVGWPPSRCTRGDGSR